MQVSKAGYFAAGSDTFETTIRPEGNNQLSQRTYTFKVVKPAIPNTTLTKFNRLMADACLAQGMMPVCISQSPLQANSDGTPSPPSLPRLALASVLS